MPRPLDLSRPFPHLPRPHALAPPMYHALSICASPTHLSHMPRPPLTLAPPIGLCPAHMHLPHHVTMPRLHTLAPPISHTCPALVVTPRPHTPALSVASPRPFLTLAPPIGACPTHMHLSHSAIATPTHMPRPMVLSRPCNHAPPTNASPAHPSHLPRP